MNFNDYVVACGANPESLTAEQKTMLQTGWRAHLAAKADDGGGAKIPTNHPANATGGGTSANEPKSKDSDSSFDEAMAAVYAENERISYIRTSGIEAVQRHLSNKEKVTQIHEATESAVRDKTVTKDKWALSLMRMSRFDAPNPHQSANAGNAINESVLEAAICLTQKVSKPERFYSPQVLEMAQSRFKRGIGLKELLVVAAERNSNYRGSINDVEAICRGAFPRGGNDGFSLSASGASTISVTGILSNVANKFLTESFLYTEQSWRLISKIKPANDFKTMTTYRLTGANTFEKLAPGGKLKDGSLGELPYTNKVETYGKKLGIDRRDIRNDDLGAFMGATAELGRGAGDSLNAVFWAEWLNDSAFFNTDKSKNNYDDGATDSVLSLAGLENADTIFRLQTKPDSTPLGLEPKILLVPTGLRIAALTLMNSTMVTGQGANAAQVPSNNPWAGAFQVVPSVFLTQTAIGGSSTAWYLLADPMQAAAIEVAFLDGIEAPTIETSEFDFDQLGLSMRAFMDFGVSKQEYRAACKMKGAA